MLLPLLGLLINATLGRRMTERAIGVIASLAVVASFVVSLILFAQLNGLPAEERLQPIELGIPWIQAGAGTALLRVPFGVLIDPLSVTMMLIVTGVGGLIHIYSIGYMHGDPRFQRFFVYMNLFVASMLVLVMANSFLLMFVGWELVGLCSYLLIGFWFSNLKNAEAGRKAFVVNRIGDVGFILGILLIFVTFGSLTFGDVFPQVAAMSALNSPVIVAITLLLFIGATGKSAQIPLLVWLPDAMAGPTPVSALIHAATMVTAGIYMMTRAHVMYAAAPDTQALVAVVGALTAFVAGSVALTQFDIKKVLAYSTIGQLGFMVAAAGLGAYVAGMFHLTTHAFFKALLFLAAGSVIHGMEHLAKHGSRGAEEHSALGTRNSGLGAQHSALSTGHSVDPQDMRNMGGLRQKMPVTFWTYVIGGLALAGVPPLAGFFSKDEIVADALAHNLPVFLLLAMAAVFTAFYVGRQLVMVFFGTARTQDAGHAQESGALMTAPLIALAVFAALAGLINWPAGSLAHWLAPVLGEAEVAPLNLGVAALFTLLALGALGVAWALYRNAFARADSPEPLAKLGPLYTFLKRAWYIDALYQVVIVKLFYATSSFLARVFDIGGIDGLVNGTGALVRNAAVVLRRVQTGFVRSYGLMMLLGVVAVVAYFLLAGAR
ncbi:MAG: NADH-quinone oxidoreductase subunit L [Chloroflexi bacterium]|nr:NADH-quinone oxidoreductase subunit L [Chloroflexota bacterium]